MNWKRRSLGQEAPTCVSGIGKNVRCWYIFDLILSSRQLQEAKDLQMRKGGFGEFKLLACGPPARK